MGRIEETRKHAYLIMCHKNPEQLMKLLKSIDDPRNDIYIHADKKFKGFSKDQTLKTVKFSKLFFIKRINSNWGGSSLIKAELELLKEATKKKYLYYHLLSGQDLPIKTQDYIHAFFQNNQGLEFLNAETPLCELDNMHSRISVYHFFQDKIGRKKGKMIRFYRLAEAKLLAIQRKLRVNRIRGKEEMYYKGAQWFSITDDLARYVISQEKYIKRNFQWSLAADEIFLQTIVMNSKFKDSVKTYMRFIDWKRGRPYVFTMDDFESLKSSTDLFARKFDEQVDAAIIDKVIQELC